MCSVIDRLSLTGTVLAMQATAVKPPAAAAWVPVRTVSLYSCPGSRRWTWMSIKPGVPTRPAASIVSAPLGFWILPSIRATAPSSISRSYDPSRPWLGSTIRPPWISRLDMSGLLGRRDAGEQIEDRQPHRHPMRDLLEDHRVGAVRHVARDLDAAVHRARMHDDGVVLGQPEALAGEAEQPEVLLDRRERHPPLPFELDAQHHHHVGSAERVLQGERHLDAQLLDLD